MPLRRAMARARVSVAGGVGATTSIFQSGWNAVKCSGTSAPSRSTSPGRRVIDVALELG
jgi:hypothetical protein